MAQDRLTVLISETRQQYYNTAAKDPSKWHSSVTMSPEDMIAAKQRALAQIRNDLEAFETTYAALQVRNLTDNV